MEFDRYRDSYHEDLERAVGFAGVDADFYTEVKANALLDLARRELGETKSLRVLDAGCGPGETDQFLEGRFGEVWGADVSPSMIDAAAARNPRASYRHFGAGEPLPFGGGEFDVSFSINVFHHIEPDGRRRFLGELRRVTRAGGLVVVFEHNPYNPGTRKVVRDCPFDEGVVLVRMREVVELMNAERLSPMERRFILFFPLRGRPLRRLERHLARLPIGAQYYVAGKRGPGDDQAQR